MFNWLSSSSSPTDNIINIIITNIITKTILKEFECVTPPVYKCKFLSWGRNRKPRHFPHFKVVCNMRGGGEKMCTFTYSSYLLRYISLIVGFEGRPCWVWTEKRRVVFWSGRSVARVSFPTYLLLKVGWYCCEPPENVEFGFRDGFCAEIDHWSDLLPWLIQSTCTGLPGAQYGILAHHWFP